MSSSSRYDVTEIQLVEDDPSIPAFDIEGNIEGKTLQSLKIPLQDNKIITRDGNVIELDDDGKLKHDCDLDNILQNVLNSYQVRLINYLIYSIRLKTSSLDIEKIRYSTNLTTSSLNIEKIRDLKIKFINRIFLAGIEDNCCISLENVTEIDLENLAIIYQHSSSADQFMIYKFDVFKNYIDNLATNGNGIADPLTRKVYDLDKDFVLKLKKNLKFVILRIDKLSIESKPTDILDQKKIVIDGLEDINSQNPSGTTFLHEAVKNNEQEIILYLIEKGIDIEALDPTGKSAIQLAINDNNHEIVKILLDQGSNFFPYYLQCAIKKGNVEIVKLLLDKIVNLGEDSIVNIGIAIDKGNLEIFKLLLDRVDNLE